MIPRVACLQQYCSYQPFCRSLAARLRRNPAPSVPSARQLLLVSSEDMDQMSAQSYAKLTNEAERKRALNTDPVLTQRVRTQAMAAQTVIGVGRFPRALIGHKRYCEHRLRFGDRDQVQPGRRKRSRSHRTRIDGTRRLRSTSRGIVVAENAAG